MWYTYNEILLIRKRMESSHRWMDLKGIMLSETNQTQKDKHHMISRICGIYKTKNSNKTPQTINKQKKFITDYWLPEGKEVVG